MLELEKTFFEEGDIGVEDILADFDPSRDESDTIKWELVEDGA
jgi:hypothetical protein